MKNNLLEKLNSYNGDNLWEDVIHQLDNPHGKIVNWEATEAEDPGDRSDVIILANGERIDYNESAGRWE